MEGASRSEHESHSHRGLLRALIEAPDSYGLLFALLIADYIVLTINWSGAAALITRTGLLALTSLLAFWTSRVPRRVMQAVAVASALTLVIAVVVAIQGQTVADGAIVLLAAA